MQISILGVEYRHFDIKDNLDFDFLSNLSVIERHYKDILKKRHYQYKFEQWIYKLCENLKYNDQKVPIFAKYQSIML